MKSPISYYGAKGRLSDFIVSLLPPHRVYVEPFFGSGAVLFAKPRSTHEILNDVDGNLVNFFRVLRDRPADLERVCRLTPYAREEFAAAELVDPDLDELERARRWWVRINQGFATLATTATGWSTSIRRGSNNARSCWNRIARFAEAAERLSSVTIENRDALAVISEYSAADGAIYVDPPYLMTTRTSLTRRPGGDYAHEFSTQDEHTRLAEALQATPAAVLLSGYPSPLYDELYAGWWRIEQRVLRRASNGRSSRNCYVVEVLWSNRPLPAATLFDTGDPLERSG